MRVFLSWSGELSEKIAQIYHNWIPSVLQAAKPYFSPKDIEKGKRWSSEIEKELHSSSICLIFLTKDNLDSNWIMFEAGAVSRSIGISHVCPILFDLEPTDVSGPLAQFQATKFDKEETKKLFLMMNSAIGEHRLNEEVANSVFEKWWPDLNATITDTVNQHKSKNGKKEDVRSDRDLIEEILLLTRNINSNKPTNHTANPLPYEYTAYKTVIKSIESIIDRIMLVDSDYGHLFDILGSLRTEIAETRSINDKNRRGIISDIKSIEDRLKIDRARANDLSLDDEVPF
ncbi:toll/interleukin-1 receptor domain-containing protein [Ancylobacter sp. SL191]|uniref:toll/interleukin-1 receptor domain-containing protein n=1 Tax=Ancylobacter sp. SL191 TaxID=2995166 RepID=UPI00226DDBCF|nr:toll/interleukin-1 receptor domain-containing protein [Ancylobacter sp. SL191]WAC29098.1 toll/interleukin-1 receptor domain-containing protein [Ancylobacter sp. SL191]